MDGRLFGPGDPRFFEEVDFAPPFVCIVIILAFRLNVAEKTGPTLLDLAERVSADKDGQKEKEKTL